MTRDIYVRIGNARTYPSRTAFVEDFLKGRTVDLLDVGNLGDGDEHVPIRRVVEENGGRYAGFDVNQLLAEKLGKTEQYIGDLHDARTVVPDASFDCIYAGEIIEHSWMPNRMIEECHRILRSGGYLILDTPNAFDAVNLVRVFFAKKDTLGADSNLLGYHEAKDKLAGYRADKSHTTSQPQHKIFYGPAMLRQLLNMHGFAVEYFAFVPKPRNFLHRLFLSVFPQGAQKIAVVARKTSLEEIYGVDA